VSVSWAKLDDRFHGNRKVRRAWKRSRASVGLYVLALTYAAQHETDGMVDAEFIDDALPKTAERDAAVRALVDCGLWEMAGEDYRIHDYLDYHPSAADAEAKREAKARRQQQWREKSARSASTDTSTPSLVDAPVDPAPALPDPTRPDPIPPLAPPANAGGEPGLTGIAPLPNCRAHGTNPRSLARLALADESAQRASLAIAGLVEPDDEHRGEWERLHTALIAAVTGIAEAYVTDFALVAVDGGTLVIGGPEAAWLWGTQRFGRPLTTGTESMGIPARFATADEFEGLRSTGEAA
jgi:hypothetical protein